MTKIKAFNAKLILKALRYYYKNHPREREQYEKEIKTWEDVLNESKREG